MKAATDFPSGKAITRVGGIERVTGAQRYTADIKLEGVLHVKLTHVPVGHARIISIDTSVASKVAGVHAVLTASDLPQPVPRFGPAFLDRPVLAVDEVKFFGEPVAAVAAEDEDAASEAARLIHVEYEELPGIYTVEDALAESALLVQDPVLRGDSPLAHTNILREWHFGWGNVETSPADLVIENSYSFPMISHFAIEPFAVMSAVQNGVVTIWSPIQHPFLLQRVIAQVLGISMSDVRIIAPDPGGAFGGKAYPKYEPLMAFLALRTGRPVRLVLSLEESFQASRRTACKVHIMTGFDRSGGLRFQDIEANFLIGAYADIADRVVSKSGYTATGPYRTEHARIIARSVLSHTVPGTAFRGFGVPQLSWALESQMDEGARQLGIDRLDIRLRNLARKGEHVIPDDTPADGDWEQALNAAAQAVGWGQPLPNKHGRGVSMGLKSSSTASVSNAIIRLHHDGSVSALVGTSDMGQGARTVISQLVAQELGVPVEGVQIVMGDTSLVPFDTSTSASRSTVFMGNAVRLGCQDILRQIRSIAAEVYDVPEGEIEISSGQVHLAGQSRTYEAVLKDYFGPPRGELIGVGSSRARYRPGHPLGGPPSFWEVVAVACEVEVDEVTGEILIHKLVTVSDVGKAINVQHVETQDEGAAIMGLGHTLMEHLILDEHGRIVNLGALDYRVPTVKDLPLEMNTLLVENQDGPGPYGAKGVGESGILTISPAVASAVYEAVGIAVRDLPLTPERVWRAIQEKP